MDMGRVEVGFILDYPCALLLIRSQSGCELQSSGCGISRVMLWLLVVKSEEDSNLHTIQNNIRMAHGMTILKFLTLSWSNSQRGVFTDLYFTSVSSVAEMMRIGLLRFIDVVNIATTNFLWIIYPVLNSWKDKVNMKEWCLKIIKAYHQWWHTHGLIEIDSIYFNSIIIIRRKTVSAYKMEAVGTGSQSEWQWR